jgi:hypothetical protein
MGGNSSEENSSTVEGHCKCCTIGFQRKYSFRKFEPEMGHIRRSIKRKKTTELLKTYPGLVGWLLLIEAGIDVRDEMPTEDLRPFFPKGKASFSP